MSDSLYDHNKDKFEIQRAVCESRNKFFLALLILVFCPRGVHVRPAGLRGRHKGRFSGVRFRPGCERVGRPNPFVGRRVVRLYPVPAAHDDN